MRELVDLLPGSQHVLNVPGGDGEDEVIDDKDDNDINLLPLSTEP